MLIVDGQLVLTSHERAALPLAAARVLVDMRLHGTATLDDEWLAISLSTLHLPPLCPWLGLLSQYGLYCPAGRQGHGDVRLPWPGWRIRRG
jgi:hypothetical protein